MNTSYRVCRLGFWLFVPMHLGNFRNAFSVTIIRPCTIIMWTFVPWIEKWDRLFSILLVVRRSAATVCYACKTASLLHELRSDCNACVSASLALALCELCICLSVWTVLAFCCVRAWSVLCVCVYAFSWKFSAWIFNSFVYVFYCSANARTRNALISF